MCYAYEKIITVGIMTFYVNTFMSISAHDAGGTASTALEGKCTNNYHNNIKIIVILTTIIGT